MISAKGLKIIQSELIISLDEYIAVKKNVDKLCSENSTAFLINKEINELIAVQSSFYAMLRLLDSLGYDFINKEIRRRINSTPNQMSDMLKISL